MGDTRIEIQAKGAVREGFQEPISDEQSTQKTAGSACVALSVRMAKKHIQALERKYH
jgi:hypothetical protein